MTGESGADWTRSGPRVRWMHQGDARFGADPPWPPTVGGVFEANGELEGVCRAALFRQGARTPIVARFGRRGDGPPPPLEPRRTHGFDVGFDTDEGRWDLAGRSLAVAWTADDTPLRLPANDDGAASAAAFWEEIAARPETTHRLLWAMSDWALPRSLRMMDGFTARVLTLVDGRGRRRLARFHWRARLGPYTLTWAEQAALRDLGGDFLCRDLCETIEAGDTPSWMLAVQLLDEDEPGLADATRLVPEARAPVRFVGRMTLDGCLGLADAGMLAFDPDRALAGIEAGPPPAPFGDPYEQPRRLWRAWTASEQAHAVAAFAEAWRPLEAPALQARLVDRLWRVDDGLAHAVAQRMGLHAPATGRRRSGVLPGDEAPDPMLSIQRRMRPTLEGKLVGMLVAHGSDAVQVRMTIDQVEQAGGYPILIAPARPETLRLSGGELIQSDADLEHSPAVLFDALAVILSPAVAAELAAVEVALTFLAEGYAQLKCIAHDVGGGRLLAAADVPPGPGVVEIARLPAAGGLRYFDRELAPLAVTGAGQA